MWRARHETRDLLSQVQMLGLVGGVLKPCNLVTNWSVWVMSFIILLSNIFEVLFLAFELVPPWDFIGRSTLLELGQGFELMTPDLFSSCEQGGVWVRDYSSTVVVVGVAMGRGGGTLTNFRYT